MSLFDKAKDIAEGVADKAKDIAGDVAEKAKDVAGDVAEKAKGLASDENIEKVAEKLKAVTPDSIDAKIDGLADKAQKLNDHGAGDGTTQD